MIDPIESLSFSIQANPGVYALLLGSGISRPAGIPTGWEITLDLVEKLAAVCEEACEPGPVGWFQRKFGQLPDYSVLLEESAKTRTERQQLLRPYFEANEQEREQRLKQPTAAHHAIAQLAAQGFIKIIITTNFDRLTESALRAAGVEPTILSSPDDLKGALPLPHIQCCVFKVHGDYLDTRIRNTPGELDEYPEAINRFLDRVFDEFGLIVCGWSASWDSALRDAICRIPSRRFTTYWAILGEPSDEAQRLIENRRAEVVPVEDADSFFRKIQHNVEAIEEFRKPHPLSTEAAVASLRRYLSEHKYRLQLEGLIDDTVNSILKDTAGSDFDVNDPQPTTETVTARICKYESVCSTLVEMAMVGGRWAEIEHCETWHRALQRLNMVLHTNGKVAWLDMQLYPGMLLLYALGLGAVEAGRLAFLGHIFSAEVYRGNNERRTVVQAFAPYQRFEPGGPMKMLEGMENCRFPLNEWMFNTMRQFTKGMILDEDQYRLNFVKLEMLMSMNSVYRRSPAWQGQTRGNFLYYFETAGVVLQEITDSIAYHRDESPFVRADIFGQTSEDCMRRIDDLKQWISSEVITRFS
ncbi:MAG: SIR2 family protein [Caldilineaceae bacterium]|nr:SIR2 family protein [Caldilineaceae bacterium]MDE0337682.1 SIR2 family protein [Caldilineaceae bacterium]